MKFSGINSDLGYSEHTLTVLPKLLQPLAGSQYYLTFLAPSPTNSLTLTRPVSKSAPEAAGPSETSVHSYEAIPHDITQSDNFLGVRHFKHFDELRG
jgi:hypothetical protein